MRANATLAGGVPWAAVLKLPGRQCRCRCHSLQRQGVPRVRAEHKRLVVVVGGACGATAQSCWGGGGPPVHAGSSCVQCLGAGTAGLSIRQRGSRGALATAAGTADDSAVMRRKLSHTDTKCVHLAVCRKDFKMLCRKCSMQNHGVAQRPAKTASVLASLTRHCFITHLRLVCPDVLP